MRLEDGFSIELVAAEPLVADPVAIEIDEFGRLYVVEMPGYPLDTGSSGRIKLLTDTDGDYHADHAIVFADSLRLPTGIMRWKRGVIVTDPPDVLYLEDSDQDGRADVRQVLLTGFALSNPQHNANTPLYGLDNWIYIANNHAVSTERFDDTFGDRGGAIYFPDQPNGMRLPRNALDRNVRFRPDDYVVEARSGRSQFGHTFDTWGRHFLNDNSHHHAHEVISARYFERNPDLAVARAVHFTPDHGNAAVVFPVTTKPEHQLLTDRGVFTSACGITWYGGGLFPAPYDQDVTFTAEPVHNLVHVDRVEADGPTFVARRVRESREFLASTDSWFRPVNFKVGPDGALYVVDFYRQIVEHPEWMDDDATSRYDLMRGTQRGRIWRIAPDSARSPTWLDALEMGDEASEALVRHLESKNAWWRLNAQRLLVDRQAVEVVASLKRLVSGSPSAAARVHALYTLDGLGRLDYATLMRALSDSHAGVRENAVRLAEEEPQIATHLARMADDPNLRVRFQVLNSLGIDPVALSAKRKIITRDIEDEWVQIAGLLALGTDAADLEDIKSRETPGRTRYLERLATIVGMQVHDAAPREILARALPIGHENDEWWKAASLRGLAEGLRPSTRTYDDWLSERRGLLQRTFADTPASDAALAVLLVIGSSEGAQEQASRLAADETAAIAVRRRALSLVPGSSYALLTRLIQPGVPAPVTSAALEALGRSAGPAAGSIVLEAWPTLTPELRERALDVFLAESRAELLLDAVQAGDVHADEVGWKRRVFLMRDTPEPVRSRAQELLRARDDPDLRYVSVPEIDGDVTRGEKVYRRVCAACHDAGYGPDLRTVQHWTQRALLAKILDPSRSVASGYESFTIALASGEAVTGIFADETPTSITVRNVDGDRIILRSNVASVTRQAGSGMPLGLDAALTATEMADLLAFLRWE